MAIEEILYSALSGDSNITDIVKTNIYSDIRDQSDSVPAIFFERSSTEFLKTLDSYVPYGQKAVFLITCFDKTRESSESLMRVIIASLAANKFMIIDQQFDFDEETQIHSTILQVDYTEIT